MIYTLATRKDYYEKAFEFFREALELNFDPDIRTFNNMLHACSLQKDLVTLFYLVDMMEERKIPRDLVSYNIELAALARTCSQHYFEYKDGEYLSLNQRFTMGFDLIERMHRKGVKPDIVTMNTLVKMHARALRDKTFEIVEELFPAYGLKPDYFTYIALIRLRRQRRQLVEARALVDRMRQEEIQITPEIYRDLIIICDRKRDLEGGKKVLKEMREDNMEPKDVIEQGLLEVFEPPAPSLVPPSFNRFLTSGQVGFKYNYCRLFFCFCCCCYHTDSICSFFFARCADM